MSRTIHGCIRLCIYLGTTHTVGASATDGRYPVAAFDTGHGFSPFVPGIAAGSRSSLSLGWDAVEKLAGPTQSALRSIKRVVSTMLPDEGVHAIDGAPTALELMAEYLLRLK